MKREHGGPELCRILVTTFGNDWYYMVRFDVGDLGRIEPSGSCPCGRDSGIILSAIEGRFSNATLTIDARLVTLKQLDDALGRVEGIEQYRLEQPEPGIYRLMLTTGIYERDDLIIRLKECLRQLYGETADISIIFLDDLKPDESGKYTLATALFPLYINDFLEVDRQDNPEKKAV
jgi:hypothetical protein